MHGLRLAVWLGGGSAEPVSRDLAGRVDGPPCGRGQRGCEHGGEQVNPQEPGLAGVEGGAELPGGVVAAPGKCAEPRDSAADEEADDPGDRARQADARSGRAR